MILPLIFNIDIYAQFSCLCNLIRCYSIVNEFILLSEQLQSGKARLDSLS